MATISTPITELFKIQHPILLAGMNLASGPELAAAVTNAGGLGVLGGDNIGTSPETLRSQIRELKKRLNDPHAPFGVDLLFPQLGGARKTNYDYYKGKGNDLVDVVIEEKAALFVSAIGVVPHNLVDKLHKAGIPIMNMIGHPRHVAKALSHGADLICAQAGEGGGHTGSIPLSILIPACADAVKGHKSALTGESVHLVAAGGIYDGRGLAACLMYGAAGVWVGTRFVASEEAGVPKKHKEAVKTAGYEDTVLTTIYTGRQLRIRRTPHVEKWENERQAEIKSLTSRGVVPYLKELEEDPEGAMKNFPMAMGRVSALIKDILPAKVIVNNMATEAAGLLRGGRQMLTNKPKL